MTAPDIRLSACPTKRWSEHGSEFWNGWHGLAAAGLRKYRLESMNELILSISDPAALDPNLVGPKAANMAALTHAGMSNNALSPGDTAMSVLVQPLVSAPASGGGLSNTAEGEMLISATWGLGTAIAQGEVVPDRVVVTRDLVVREAQAGRKDHGDHCHQGGEALN
jgi:hypothetical protein